MLCKTTLTALKGPLYRRVGWKCDNHPSGPWPALYVELARSGNPIKAFFLITSWSICLSKLRSATNCFSCWFSSAPAARFELAKPTKLGNAQVAVLLFPVVKGGFADAHFPANLSHNSPGGGLAKRKYGLCFDKFGRLRDDYLVVKLPKNRPNSLLYSGPV